VISITVILQIISKNTFRAKGDLYLPYVHLPPKCPWLIHPCKARVIFDFITLIKIKTLEK